MNCPNCGADHTNQFPTPTPSWALLGAVFYTGKTVGTPAAVYFRFCCQCFGLYDPLYWATQPKVAAASGISAPGSQSQMFGMAPPKSPKPIVLKIKCPLCWSEVSLDKEIAEGMLVSDKVNLGCSLHGSLGGSQANEAKQRLKKELAKL